MNVMWIVINVALLSPPENSSGEPEHPGVDLMFGAIQKQGSNPKLILSGYAEIEMISREAPPPAETIKTQSEEIERVLRNAYSDVTDERLKINVERAIQEMPNTLIAARTERRSRFSILFDGNDFSGLRRFSVSNWNRQTEEWSKPYLALRRYGGAAGGENVLWNPTTNLATLGDMDVALPEFQEFGRLTGIASKLLTAASLRDGNSTSFQFSPSARADFRRTTTEIEAKTGLKLFNLKGTVKYDDHAVASIVECEKSGIVSQRYWIDASRGYVCPLIQFFDETGSLVEEWKSANYFLHKQSGLWFPASHVHTRFQKESKDISKQEEFRIDPATLELNERIAPSDFFIEIPTNARVIDSRSGRQDQYSTSGPVRFTFVDNTIDLRALAMARIPETSTGSIRRKWLLAISGISCVLLSIAIITKQMRHRQRMTFLLLIATLGQFAGCTRITESTAPSPRNNSNCGCGSIVSVP